MPRALQFRLGSTTCALACMIIGLLSLSRGARAQQLGVAQSAPQLQVVESSGQRIVMELSIQDFSVESLAHADQTYARVNIAGMQQTVTPGEPQVPTRRALLGVPTIKGLHVEVLAADDETIRVPMLYPAPQVDVVGQDLDAIGSGELRESFALDTSRYATDAFYPALPVELGETGYMRDQAVAQIIFYPAQYNPVRGELHIYKRLRVQITWDASVSAALVSTRIDSAGYADLMRSVLLNYDSLLHSAADANEVSGTTQVTSVVTMANSPALKVGVDSDGFYRLTYADLHNAGFYMGSIDPHTIKLLNRGKQVAIYVAGEGDGHFDVDDYILFYGIALHDPYTSLNVYWLSAGGDVGQRMATDAAAPAVGATSSFQPELYFPIVAARYDAPGAAISVPQTFPALLHTEEDTVYWQTMPGTGEDRWFWGKRLGPDTKGIPGSRPYGFTLHNISPTGTATLRVLLKGYTSLGHRTRILLNGHQVDDQLWSGQVQFIHQVYLPQALLREGENTLVVQAVESQAPVDQILVNWIELNYWDRFVAEDNQLSFSAPATGRFLFEVGGFSRDDVDVFDITDSRTPVRITKRKITAEGHSYKATFEDTAWATSHYIALSTAQYRSPDSIVLDQPSSWKSTSNGADYIIITHEDFYDSALALAEYRRSEGLRVAIVKVGDIYDEFNDGIFSPTAIHDFLVYTYANWQAPAPTYVLLIGDASQDYKDNLRSGTINFVPSQTIEGTLFGEVSSDNSFALVHGDDNLPDLMIGRLVAQSKQEAADMSAKIINYDRFPPDASWNENVLLVADDDETVFKTTSDRLSTRIPHGYNVSRVYVADYPPGNPQQDIVNHINSGSVLVNYAGHGEYFGWGTWRVNQESVFDTETVAHLSNSNRLAIITTANCLNGFFAGPKDKPSLAEVLQRARNGGAIGIWAPTSMESVTGHGILLGNLYEAIFQDDQRTLGAATTAAKLATLTQSDFWEELVDTYVLFGDPATAIGIPQSHPYVVNTEPLSGATGVSLDQHMRITFDKHMAWATISLDGDGVEAIELLPSWNQDHTVAEFVPAGLIPDKLYSVTVFGQDMQGNDLKLGLTPNPWSFVTTEDAVGPNVTVDLQGSDPTTAMSKSVLSVSFSERVRIGSVVYIITPPVPGALIWGSDRTNATFRHDDFREGQSYTFRIDAAQDVAGNWLAKPVYQTFTVTPSLYNFLPSIFR